MTNFLFSRGKPRTGAALSALVATAALAGCAAPGANADDSRPLVLTTFTVLADLASNVAGEHLRIESITKPGAEIHGYEPTPADLRHAEDADLILDNGLNLERWFEQFVQESKAPHAVVSAGIAALPITEDAYQGQDNPHAWMSPVNAQVYVDNIVAAFSDLDPANAASFRDNGTRYKTELQSVQDELVAGLAALPEGSRALVSCEGAFSYLARDAGLTEAYLWPVNADQQGTPQQIARTVTFVRDNQVPAVFCESTVSNKAQLQVAADTGAAYGGELYVDSLSEPGGPVPTYLDLLRHDATTIVSGLTGG